MSNPAQDATKPPKRGTRPGSIRQLRLRLWWAIDEATRLLDQPDPELKLRAIHAMSTAAGTYGRLTELHTLETAVTDVQRELRELRTTLSRPASATKRSAAPPVN